MNKVLFSSKSDEWETPIDIFNKLNAEFHFDLDPCSTDSNHKCDKYFTKEINGLSKNWGGVECFAIHLIAIFRSGLKRLTGKVSRIIHLLYCLSRREQTQDIFMTIYIKGQRSDL